MKDSNATVEGAMAGGSEPDRPKIGIALGSGGAKGLAHIPMLEALDELGVTPARISGCSIGAVIAVDINSGSASEDEVPGYFDTMFGAIQIMQRSITEQKLRLRAPDIYIRPALRAFRTLHFLKAEQIYNEAQPSKEELKRKLGARLESWGLTLPS